MTSPHWSFTRSAAESLLREQVPGLIILEDVVLQIDRMLRVVGERDPAHQRVVILGLRAESRFDVAVTIFGRATRDANYDNRLMQHHDKVDNSQHLDA